jgi:hypothetical protein
MPAVIFEIARELFVTGVVSMDVPSHTRRMEAIKKN